MSDEPVDGEDLVRGDWPRLMARAQAGDQAAYAQLLKALVPPIRSIVRRRIVDEARGEDVVQETLLAIHRLRHTYDPGRPMLPWVVAIASARTIDALRQCGRRQGREVQDEAAILDHGDPGALRSVEHLEARRDLDRLLARLPGRQREAVELVRLRELSLADAAAASRQSVPALKALLNRGLRALRLHGASDVQP